MPPENAVKFNNAVLMTQDGKLLCYLQDAPEMVVTDNPKVKYADTAPSMKEITVSCKFHMRKRERNYILWGWTAKGPVRKRLLRNTRAELTWRYTDVTD